MGTAPFAPQVEQPRPRLRIELVVALLVVMAAAVVTLLVRGHDAMPPPPQLESRLHLEHCTPLEIEVYLSQAKLDPPDEVACYAVAGKLDHVRALLAAMPADDRMATVRTPGWPSSRSATTTSRAPSSSGS